MKPRNYYFLILTIITIGIIGYSIYRFNIATSGRLKQQINQKEEVSREQPGLWSWDIEEFQKKGLKDPIKDLKSDLMKHNELIPFEGTLGGTMGFYSEDRVWVLTKKWVLASFDDGHKGGCMLLEYVVSDNGKISWKVIDSYLD